MFWSTQLYNAFLGYADNQKKNLEYIEMKKQKKAIGQIHSSTGFRWI